MKINNDDILVQFKKNQNDYLIINFKDSFRSKKWTIYLGLLQRIFETYHFLNQKINKILFDISRCKWIDPLPILSLCMLIIKNNNKLDISVKVPELYYSQNTDRVLKFLQNEGFFTLIKDYTSVFDVSGNINQKRIEQYSNIVLNLAFTNASLLPLTVVDLKDIESKFQNIDYWLDSLNIKIRAKLMGIIPENQLDLLIYKTKIFYGETLHNINKHAYYNSKTSYAGMFIRLRFGVPNESISESEKLMIEQSIKQEKIHCPRLEPEFVEMNELFIELFVLDLGVGLYETLKKIFPKKKSKFPFRKACNAIFIEGKKTITSKNFTQYGGLYNLGELFEINYDFLCGKDLNEWVGDFLPFENKFSYAFIDSEFSQSMPISHSLAWIGRISSNQTSNNGNDIWTKWDGSIHRHPIFLSYSSEKQFIDKVFLQYKIYDFRQFIIDKEIDRYKEIQENKCGSINTSKLLVFPKINLSKTGVWKLLEQISEDIDSLDMDRHLFIVDILDIEKHSYIAALNNPQFDKKQWPLKFNRIFLVTRNLSVCILNQIASTKDKISFTVDYDAPFNYFDFFSNESIRNNPTESLSGLYLWIRMYESLLFWNYLSKNNKNDSLFINREIKWNNDIPSINGYLNFAQTVADTFLKKICLINLERSKGIFLNTEIQFNNMDIITANFSDELNSNLATFSNALETSIINIGSVFVSGQKEREAQFAVKKDRNHINIHCFVHPDSKSKVESLFTWPNKKWIETNIPIPNNQDVYERVGRTHVVAKYGWKYFPIPRYNSQNMSFYHRTPKETYEDWQSQYFRFIKIGNFRYNDYFELFKIDLHRIISMSFEFKEELANYLIEQFFFALGGKTKSDLTKKGQQYSEKINYFDKQNIEFYKNIKAVVYPNHSNTSFVIEKVKEYLSDDLTKKIFPFTPVKDKTSSSALIISPLIFDSIENLLKESAGIKEILFFDDSIVSGRTRKEIKHILKGLGADNIKTLTILDRNRLPFHLPSSYTYKAYWRLDVPRLGDNANNPINRALIELNSIEKKLIKPLLIFRIKTIQKNWHGMFLFQDNSQVGIDPIKTKLSILNGKNEKRFGINKSPPHEQIGGDKNKINIKTSLGLTLYATEVHSITGKDDIALNFCKNPNYRLSNEAKIELVGSQLILFQNEHPKEVHYELLRELLNATLKISKSNNHTAFSIIVLISQNYFYLKKLVGSFVNYLIEQKISIDNLNIDLKIFLSYYYQSFNDSTSKKTYLSIIDNFFEESFSLSIETYTEFHFEIYDSEGILHDTPLLRLCESYGDSTKHRLEAARFSFQKLRGIIQDKLKGCTPRSDYKYFKKDYIKESDEQYDSFTLKQKSINLLDDYFYRTQELLITVIWNENGIPKFDKQDIEITCLVDDVKEKLLSCLRLFHSSITFPIKGKHEVERPFEIKMIKLIESIDSDLLKKDAINKKQKQHANNDILIGLSSYYSRLHDDYQKYKNLWIPFDLRVQNQILDILSNSVYSIEPIKDPWYTGSNNKNNLWVKISYLKNNILIHFANKSINNPYTIKTSFLNKRKHDKDYFKKIECVYNVKYIDKNEGIIEVTFSIPIIT